MAAQKTQMVVRTCGPQQYCTAQNAASSNDVGCPGSNLETKAWHRIDGGNATKQCGDCDYGCEYYDGDEAKIGDLCYDQCHNNYKCMGLYTKTTGNHAKGNAALPCKEQCKTCEPGAECGPYTCSTTSG